MTSDRIPVRRALISVSDKSGLLELAHELAQAGVEIVSTGSTASAIAEAGIPVTSVADVTGFPEILDGRVKTLHPAVHGGLLGRPADPEHSKTMVEHGITAFELLVVNLYPFAQTLAAGGDYDACVENIDIGGPAMVRAAAKNHETVCVVTSPGQYPLVVEALGAGGFTYEQRQRLAARAYAHTAAYDTAVAQWLADEVDSEGGWPRFAGVTSSLAQPLRYGENPHQRAALYREDGVSEGVAAGELLQGKAMSYNNYVDADAAWRAAHDHGDNPTVAIIKHANPCGIAIGDNATDAYAKAFDCDPLSAFGGVVALNVPVDEQVASRIASVFTEVVVAPNFTDGARRLLAEKTALRLLRALPPARDRVEWRAISGGILRQSADSLNAPGDDPATWVLVAGPVADTDTLAELRFAWRACRAVKSNAILLATAAASVGVGMGQVNRVDAAKLAVSRAGVERARGSVAASDAFFPFADGLQVLIDAGVRAVVQPGGSKRDDEVIAAASAAGMTMYFTCTRHFAH